MRFPSRFVYTNVKWKMIGHMYCDVGLSWESARHRYVTPGSERVEVSFYEEVIFIRSLWETLAQ